MSKRFDTVYYHDPCCDGFCAAWAARQACPGAKFIPIQYGKFAALDDVLGKRVLVVDFSWPRKELLALKADAADLVVLDHHKTAQADLAGLDFCTFDMERSGATLAWDYFNAPLPRPWVVSYCEDRDLWRHALPHTKELNASIQAWPKDFGYWSTQAENDHRPHVERGRAILQFQEACIAEFLAGVRYVSFEGQVRVPVVNVHGKFASDVLHRAGETFPFAVGWYQDKDGRYVYSLRSAGAFDVAELAKRYGGGGHKNAAGFKSGKLLF